jgi:hypothetical protein
MPSDPHAVDAIASHAGKRPLQIKRNVQRVKRGGCAGVCGSATFPSDAHESGSEHILLVPV